MSSKQNHTINPGNFEEFFILYMDNELTAEQKEAVDAFLLQHPHLADELELLMGTKLSPETVSFAGKEELLSPAMKLNTVDEALLLYIDNELPSAEKTAVEKKIEADKEYALQHSWLMKTKLDAGERIPHPNKKELYRRTERVVVFRPWMRIAAAVILLLFASWFFLLNNKENTGSTEAVVNNGPLKGGPDKGRKPKESAPQNKPVLSPLNDADAAAPATDATAAQSKPKAPKQTALQQDLKAGDKEQMPAISLRQDDVAFQPREVIRVDVSGLASKPSNSINALALNETITHKSVTSKTDSSYNRQNVPNNNPEVDWAVETEKKAPARGFFRKVSRFIERKTGIGTVNADNELLIGAVALKLK